MANGFMPYLLMQAKDIFLNATPSQKLTPPGYLKYLLSNNIPNIVNKGIDDGSGHLRDVKFSYSTRLPGGRSGDTDDCEINIIPVRKEDSITTTFFRKLGIFIEDETIAKYEKEASATVALGQPPTDFMRETFDSVIRAANGLFADIDKDLLVAQSNAFGVNVVTGVNTPQTLNLPLSTTTNPLNQGMTKVMADAMENEMNIANSSIVGSGLINNYYLQNPAKSAAQNGLDTSALAMPGFFYDPYAAAHWGANEFALFEKNAVQLININRFSGFKSGDKMVTRLGTLTLPVVDFLGDGMLQKFTFDYQWKYIDCPTEVTVLGYGGETTSQVTRGWVLILMASFDQFNVPNDAYEADDRLFQNNGSLLFAATNA